MNRKVAGSDPSWLMMQEVRIEDCTSDSSAEPAPWEDTMRLMPPLLELADMFNIILRRCRNSRADSDLVRGAPLQQLLISCCSCMSLRDVGISVTGQLEGQLGVCHSGPGSVVIVLCGTRQAVEASLCLPIGPFDSCDEDMVLQCRCGYCQSGQDCSQLSLSCCWLCSGVTAAAHAACPLQPAVSASVLAVVSVALLPLTPHAPLLRLAGERDFHISHLRHSAL